MLCVALGTAVLSVGPRSWRCNKIWDSFDLAADSLGALSWVETPAAEGSQPSRVSPASSNPQKFEQIEGTGVCVTKHS